MKYSPAFLEDIRNRLPISVVVSRKVKLTKKGKELWGSCPFHSEKSASFKCNDQRGRFHCFGCGEDGDIFGFIMRSQGRTFPEAIEDLAGLAGVAIPQSSAEDIKRDARRLSLIDVIADANAFFLEQLRKPVGAEALAYARSRMNETELQRFKVGYAPADRAALKNHLAGKGVDPAAMIEAGLLVAGDDIPVSYDRFRDRLMFPILDEKGRPIAFGGRAMQKDTAAKYLNSPETPTFSKGLMLYNQANAKAAAWDDQPLVVVEGYVDVIASVGAGFEATVAPMGTALTDDQLRLLWRMSDEPIVCFDGDSAGTKAAYRLLDLSLPLITPGRTLRFAMLPAGQDPDDVIRQKGASAFRGAITAALPLIDVMWRRATNGRTFDSPDKLGALERSLLEMVKPISDDSLRTHYIREIRDRVFAIPRQTRIVRSNGVSNHSASPAAHRLVHGFKRSVGITLREATIISAMVANPEAALDAGIEISADNRLSDQARGALGQILEILSELPDATVDDLMTALHRDGGGRTIDEAIDMCRGAGLASIGPEGDSLAAADILRSETRH